MKKKIVAFALAAVALIASAPAASAQADRGKCTKSECKVDGQNRKADKMYRPQKFTDFAFEGVLLSVDQQAKVDAVNAEFKARRELAKVEREKARKERREKCDSTVCPTPGQCDSTVCLTPEKCVKPCKDGKRPCDFRKEYVQKIKEILTPEQYTTFLENIVFMPQPQKAFHRGDRKGPADRKFGHGPRECKNKAKAAACDNAPKAEQK